MWKPAYPAVSVRQGVAATVQEAMQAAERAAPRTGIIPNCISHSVLAKYIVGVVLEVYLGSFSIWHWLIVIIVTWIIFFDWRKTYDWYLIRRFVHRTNFRCWRVRTFASRFSSITSIKATASKLNSEALMWALRISDHRPIAKEAIHTELAKRGVTEERIASWVPDPVSISAPNTLPAISVETYRHLVHRRRIWRFIIRCAAIIWMSLFLLAMLDDNIMKNGGGDSMQILLVTIPILAAIAMWHTRRRCLRILLLRPFGKRRLSRPLKKLVVSSIGPFGSVYTLSDRNYRPSLLVAGADRIIGFGILVFGPVLRSTYRAGSVKNERTFINVARKLSKWRMRSFLGMLIGDQAFNIKSSNGWWQMQIDMLLHSTEIVIMDVSHIGVGSAWEIGHMARRGLFPNCIFIAQDGVVEKGLAAVSEIVPHLPAKIWPYCASGRLLDRDGFNSVMEERISAALTGELSHPPGAAPVTGRICANDVNVE